jgi:outer membrane protein TolC
MKIIKTLLSAAFIASTVSVCAQMRVVTLDELYTLADGCNYSLKATSAAVEEAQASVAVSKSERLPSVDISLQFCLLGDAWIADRDFTNGMNADMPHFGNNFSFEVVQVLYAGGMIKRGIEMSELNKAMAELKHQNNKQAVRMLLTGYYLDLFKLYNQRHIFLKNIEQTEKLLSDIVAAFDAGTALSSDITRYELLLENLKLSLTQIDNTMNIINRQLTIAVGLPHETIICPDTSLVSASIICGDEEQWQQLVTQSPTLRMSQVEVQMSEQGEKLARSKRLPTVALVVGDKFDGPIVIEVPPIDKNLNYWYAGIGVNYSLGSLYKQDKKVRESQLVTAVAREKQLEAASNLQSSVHAAYIRLKEAFPIIEIREKSLQLAQENYDVVHYRYVNGMALITDMLDASNQKLTAELQLANARVELIFNHCTLRSIVGVL